MRASFTPFKDFSLGRSASWPTHDEVITDFSMKPRPLRAADVDVLVSFLTPQEVMEFDLKEEADYITQLLHLCTGYSP